MLSECEVTLIRAERITASLLLAFSMDNTNYPEQKGIMDTNIRIVLQYYRNELLITYFDPESLSDVIFLLITYYL
jgi:Na+-transporting NADH:ubiquinone oxidoreductase subunit NqrF